MTFFYKGFSTERIRNLNFDSILINNLFSS